MSWLSKDPIVTVASLNFDHTQSNIKEWPEKIKLPQMRIFLKKQLKTFSCTSWSFLLSKINKKTWEQIQSEEDTVSPLFQNDQIALNTITFLSEKPLIWFPCLSWPHSLWKNVKQSLQLIQNFETGCNILGLKSPFIVQNF